MFNLDDTGRALLMNAVTVLVALAAAFGASLTQEQSAGIVAAASVLVNLWAYLTRPPVADPPP